LQIVTDADLVFLEIVRTYYPADYEKFFAKPPKSSNLPVSLAASGPDVEILLGVLWLHQLLIVRERDSLIMAGFKCVLRCVLRGR
jgi:hypothetical protein